MRRWAIGMGILSTVLAAGLIFGCEDKRQPEKNTAPYDPKVDAPPTNLHASPHSDLLADQAEVARGSAAAPAATDSGKKPTTPGAGTPAESDSIKAVRAELGKIINGAQGGDWAALTEAAASDDKVAIDAAATQLAKLDEAEKTVTATIKEKTEKEPSPLLGQLMERGVEGKPFLVKLSTMSLDSLAFADVDADTVSVKDNAGLELAFKKAGDKWLLTLTAKQREETTALAELAAAQVKVATEINQAFATSEANPNNPDETINAKAKPVLDARKRLKEVLGMPTDGGATDTDVPAGPADPGGMGGAPVESGSTDTGAGN